MTRSLSQLFLAFAWFSLSSVVWGATATTTSVKEAPIPSDGMGPQWLDNHHVMFRTFTPGESGEYRFYVWDIDRGTAIQDPRFPSGYPHVDPDMGVLTSRGVRYKNYEDQKGIPVPPGTCFNPISGRPCKSIPPPWVVPGGSPNGHTSTSKIPLKEEDGYLDRGPDGQDQIKNFPIFYHHTGVTEPISLGLGSQQVEPRVVYYPFVGAYLLRGVSGTLNAPPLWLLHPNGTLELIFTPERKDWTKQVWSWLLLTKPGVVFERNNYRGEEVRDSGLYLYSWDRGELTRLVAGVFSWGAVSPDGCKLAVTEDRLRVEERYRLRIIDLCRGIQR